MIDSIFNLQLFAEGGDGAAPGVSSVPAEGVEGTTGEWVWTETGVHSGTAFGAAFIAQNVNSWEHVALE